jgi:Ca-activated chloride channel family protein
MEISHFKPEFLVTFDSYCHSLAGFEKKAASSDLKISSIMDLNLQNPISKVKAPYLMFRLVALSSLIVAMARPRTVDISIKQRRQKG